MHPTHLKRVEGPACIKRPLRYSCSPPQPTAADSERLLLLLLLRLLDMLLLAECWGSASQGCSCRFCRRLSLFLTQRCCLCADILAGLNLAPSSSSLPGWCVEPTVKQQQKQSHRTDDAASLATGATSTQRKGKCDSALLLAASI